MDSIAIVTPSARPRPDLGVNRRVSKLPVPIATPSQGARATSPAARITSREVQAKRSPQPSPPARKISYARKAVTLQLPSNRQPLRPPQRPHSKQETRLPMHSESISSRSTSPLKLSRNLSQQENFPAVEAVGATVEVDRDASPEDDIIKDSVRRHRPSLSDRTRESLSLLPQSPANCRRQSAFFTPTKPADASHPASALDVLSMPRKREDSSQRQASPAKPQPGTGRRPLGVRQSSATIASKPVMTAPSTPRVASPTRAARPPSSYKMPAAIAGTRQSSTSKSPVKSAATPAAKLPAALPMKPTPQPATTLKPRSSTTAVSKSKAGPPAGTQNSSELLRQKIAQARATQRKGAASVSHDLSFVDSQIDGDSFSQTMRSTKELLLKRIDDARRDGILNIAALSLKTVPDEVMHMYDESAMQASSVTWSETVDLVRLNAADNEIEELGDEVFPDLSREEMLADPDSKGNQFGGLEALDLHGNLLPRIPIGIRRLDRLTTLNLSHNNLTNDIFPTLTHLTSLRTLDLSHNALARDIPTTLLSLVSLETLNLSHNRIALLPPTLAPLTHLHTLHLSHNRLPSLPFATMTALPLAHLHAAANAFTCALLPDTITSLPRLRTLDVGTNALVTLTFSATLSLPALQHLDVSSNRLAHLPPGLCDSSNLATLLAQDNALTDLPPRFADLGNLRTANLGCCNLRAVDPCILDMPALESFVVAGNPLRERTHLSMSLAELRESLRRRMDCRGALDGAVGSTAAAVAAPRAEGGPEARAGAEGDEGEESFF